MRETEGKSKIRPGKATGGKSLRASSKVRSRSGSFLGWARAVSCDSGKKQGSPGSPELGGGAMVSENKHRTNGNHQAYLHLLTLQSRSECSKH